MHKSIVNASIWCQKTSRSVCQHFWMKSKSLVFGGFLDLSGENGSNIVNNQLTGLILLCKVFETSSQSSKCLLVLPYQWLVRHRQKKFHLSLVFAYCTCFWNSKSRNSVTVILVVSVLSLDCSLDVTFQTYICCQFCNPKKVAFFTLCKKKETPVELKSLKQKESQFSVQQ